MPLARRVAGLALALLLAGCRTTPHEDARPELPAATRTTTVAASGPRELTPPKLRLPRAVVPVRAHVELTLTPGELGFRGTIDHQLRVAEATDVIWLHAVELTLSDATVTVSGRTIAVRVITTEGSPVAGFAMETPLAAGTEATLHVAFAGKVSDENDRGLFFERAGDDPFLFSQLETLEARRVFPCFDEPSFKHPWQVALDVPAEDVALSNTPAIRETPLPGNRKRVEFAETKALPSYLVAFVVGPFALVDGGEAGRAGTPIRIAVPKIDLDGTRWAVESTKPLLESLEEYFDLPFPYEKLDVVVVPNLVSFSAMENAGLITIYREGSIARPAEETVAFRRNYAVTMAHELAHQWFGDSVTLAWWDDVWLNESFATWMEAEILGRWRPEWRWSVERTKDRASAIEHDRLASARRVRQAITSEDDIENAFDGVSYAKGSSVIAMFQTWLGEDVFRAGVRDYLVRHAGGNATSADFLAAISGAAGRDVSSAFGSFLDQSGVPEVSFTVDSAVKPPVVHLAQQRHRAVGSSATAETWRVPVCVRYEAKAPARACTLLEGRTGDLVLDRADHPPKWIIPNDGGHGYYVATYDEAWLGTLLALPRTVITLEEELAVLADLGARLAGGRVAAGAALAEVPKLLRDPSPHVQTAAVNLARTIPSYALDPALREAYARWVRETFGARARALGLVAKKGEGDELAPLRRSVVELVATIGRDPALLADAQKLALAWLERPASLPEDSVGLVLEAAASGGDRALFDRFVATLETEKDPRRRGHILRALADFQEPDLVRAALDLYLGDRLDPREALPLVMQGATVQEITYAHLVPKFDRYLARLPADLRSYAPWMAGSFCSRERAKDVETFFQERVKSIVGGPRRLEQVLESIEHCAALKDSQTPSLQRFLK